MPAFFDEIRVLYRHPPDGTGLYRTDDLGNHGDLYELRADGTLWHENDYGIWELVAHSGFVQFYKSVDGVRVAWMADFVDGQMRALHWWGEHSAPSRKAT